MFFHECVIIYASFSSLSRTLSILYFVHYCVIFPRKANYGGVKGKLPQETVNQDPTMTPRTPKQRRREREGRDSEGEEEEEDGQAEEEEILNQSDHEEDSVCCVGSVSWKILISSYIHQLKST